MADFIVNKAGAKVYKDINKHRVLNAPALSNESEKGTVYNVLSVGILGGQREPIVTVKETDGEVVVYRLPYDLVGWVENFMGMKLHGIDSFPAKVEFGKLNGRVYAEIL
ncbi:MULTISPECIES: hypothetical protein [Bacillus subtilis group]|uniref:hypothetical protein n=1 Tax=Bacillus subtilis group TaxID=653685 RepID=UPI000EFAA45C|nr:MULTISPECIES: hypothetical protein [Bacillus subtilis group]HBO5951995.1 hypothetical protein [Pseudomonas aeruginosa]MCT6515493.1 hypothetical protein [Bacillus subtilis]MCV4329546.1 hypothetical protein [Bacillus velezensis]MDH3075877.1 hypothetical protein [Bacillus velezensis]MDH3104061.1 hypothetical protein [Bacillus velezensis]